MKISSSALSDRGRQRTENEDAFLTDQELQLYVVCDGMGGHLAGAEASQMATRVVRSEIGKHASTIQKHIQSLEVAARHQVSKVLEEAVAAANAAIFSAAREDPTKRGMGTTLELLLVAGRYAFVLHVGDSRIYLVRDRKIHQLTEDHSFVGEMVRNGKMTREEAARSSHAHMITRAVGVQALVRPDVLQVELMEGDVFLLCSDGLTDLLTDEELLHHGTVQGIEPLPAELIKVANARGGRDNITAVVVKIHGDATTTEEFSAVQKLAVLGRIPLFRHLSYPELTKVLSIAHVRKIEKDTTVFQEGAPGDEMLILLAGKVNITKAGEVVAFRGPGDSVGEMGLIGETMRSASVIAVEPSAMLVFTKTQLFGLLRSDSGLAVKFLWMMCCVMNARVSEATDKLVEISVKLHEKTTELPFSTIE